MKIFIEKDNKNIIITFKGSVLDLLRELDITSDSVLVVRNNHLLNDDSLLNDSDEIKLLSVVSGG